MLKRSITGAALIVVLVAVLLFLPAWCTAILLSAMVFMAVSELLKTTGLVDNKQLILYAQAIAIATSPFIFNSGEMAIPAIIYALLMNVILLIYIYRFKQAK